MFNNFQNPYINQKPNYPASPPLPTPLTSTSSHQKSNLFKLLQSNKGQIVNIHLVDQTIKGILDSTGEDFVIIYNPKANNDNKHYVIRLDNIIYFEFEEKIKK